MRIGPDRVAVGKSVSPRPLPLDLILQFDDMDARVRRGMIRERL